MHSTCDACEDRLFDLVWERQKHQTPGAKFSNDRSRWIDAEIVRLASFIFQSSQDSEEGNFKWTADDATQLIAWLYDPVQLNRLGFSRGQLGRNRPRVYCDSSNVI